MTRNAKMFSKSLSFTCWTIASTEKKHQQLNEMSIVLWYLNVHLYCKQNVVDDHKRSKYPRINDSCIQMNLVVVLTAMLI